MRIGFYCESPADKAAMAVLVEGILGEPAEPINMPLEAQSVPRFFSALDGVCRGVHYNSDAEGLVIVVDSDRTELHEPDHGDSGEREGCRYCQIRKIVERARAQLRPREGRPELKVAIGLAVPEIGRGIWWARSTRSAKRRGEWGWMRARCRSRKRS
jgi:hypothetical protein